MSSTQAAPTPSQSSKLNLPSAVRQGQINWAYAISFLVFHLAALLAFVPYFFSWTGVIIAFLGCYVFGSLGINLGYHRLLTHRSLECPKWLERTFVVLGVCCMQDAPARWVATHRMHHQHSDQDEDPHSPYVTFYWGHMGWLVTKNADFDTIHSLDRYARDILRDRFYFQMQRGFNWFYVFALHVLVMVGGAGLAGLAIWGPGPQTMQLMASVLVWGVVVRTVVVWHITWFVNSAAHRWGYRNYETKEQSRNNWWVALISNGEGWHNNHHADPRSAAHGHRWWEFDVVYTTIWVLKLVGLAKNVVPIRAKQPWKDPANKGKPAEIVTPLDDVPMTT